MTCHTHAVSAHNLVTEAPCILASAATGILSSHWHPVGCARTSHTVIYLVVMMSLFLGQKRGGSMEEQAQDSLGLDVYRRRLGEARRLVLEDPGARVQPTCFLTPILLPVNPAALQPEWPDRTLWVWLPSCFVLHQAGSPASHNCSLPVAASYTKAQSWSC